MAVVTLVAIAMAKTNLWQRWQTYRHLAWQYESREFKRRQKIESATEALRKYPGNKNMLIEPAC